MTVRPGIEYFIGRSFFKNFAYCAFFDPSVVKLPEIFQYENKGADNFSLSAKVSACRLLSIAARILVLARLTFPSSLLLFHFLLVKAMPYGQMYPSKKVRG
jgi:hypothetical protein